MPRKNVKQEIPEVEQTVETKIEVAETEEEKVEATLPEEEQEVKKSRRKTQSASKADKKSDADEENVSAANEEDTVFESQDEENEPEVVSHEAVLKVSEEDENDNSTLEPSSEEAATREAEVADRRDFLAERRKREREREEANSNRQQTLLNWEQLKSARREKRILTGKIISVENINNSMIVGVLNAGGFRVIIPFSEMYNTPSIDITTVRNMNDKLRREQQMLTKLLDAEIPYIITEISGAPETQADYAIVASRKEALKRTAAIYFDKDRLGRTRTNVGDVVDATIGSVGIHAVWVNVLGIDISIPVYRLTYRYVNDARKAGYSTGQTIKVAITSINHDAAGKCTDISVSGKIPEAKEFVPKLKNINRGARCLGRITHVSRAVNNPGKTIISLFLESVGVPAIATYTRLDTLEDPPIAGDKVKFSIRDIREDRGIVIGTIIGRA